MTLRSRLILGLLTIAIILIVPLLVAMRSLDSAQREAELLRDDDFAASLLLGRVRDALNDLRTAELRVLFLPENPRRDMTDRVEQIHRLADSLETYQLGNPARAVRAAMSTVIAGGEAEFRATVAERKDEADRISKSEVQPAITRAEAAVVAAERELNTRTRDRVAIAAAHARQGREAAIIGLALAIIVATLIAGKLTQSVSLPVRELERGMRRVADGEVDAKVAISPSRTDEFGRLAASFEEMTRQLAELDKLKAEFVSIASHELKTPINVILGYTQLLQEGMYGPLSDPQRGVTVVLEKQINALSRMVRQLLDVTRFEAGGGKLEVRPVEVRALLHGLEEGFRVLADQRGVRFQVSVAEQVPDSVDWDADRMNEVLGNLLSNAFKFTEHGGEVDLMVHSADHSVQIEVRDTGAGIPPDQVGRIFDKFFQASNQGAAAGSGSGLGLAIARQIVDAHHGTITCDSTPGVGTTFTIMLPEHVSGRHGTPHEPVVAEVV